jgi:hypothetical protein
MTHPQVLAYVADLASQRSSREGFVDHHLDLV